MEVIRGKNRKIIWDEECTNFIIDCYQNKKMSIANIGKEIKVSPQSISGRLKECGIHIRTDREQALKYSVNEHFFDVIDNEKKAYWLGFMYADGYITDKRKHSSYRIGMSLSLNDIERLESFKKDLEYTGLIKIYEVKQGYKPGIKYGRLLIASNQLAEALIDKGCIVQKTKKLTFPPDSIVPKELKYHFIRGYLDGDGSIIVRLGEDGNLISGTIGFTGTKEFLTGLKDFLNKSQLAFDKRYKDREDNIYSLNIGGEMQVIEMCYRLYGHATTYMERKYKKYRLLVNEYFKTGRTE